MMEFLDKIFAYEYFPTILFSTIGFLVLSFFAVLFFGKKDEGKRKLEETRKLELANVNAFSETSRPTDLTVEEPVVNILDSDDTMKKEAPLINNENGEEEKDVFAPLETTLPEENIIKPSNQEIIKEPVKYDDIEVPAFSLPINELEKEKDIVSEAPVLSPIEEAPLNIKPQEQVPVSPFKIEPTISQDKMKYNFDELASSIAKELDDIDKLSKKVIESSPEEIKIPSEPANIDVTPIKEVTSINRPVFSSVYVDKKEDRPALDFPDFNEQKISLENNDEEKSFAKPKIDLPKPAEMPVLKEEEQNEVVSSPIFPDFSNIETETYNIK